MVVFLLIGLELDYRVRLDGVRFVELLRNFGSSGLKVLMVFCEVLWLVIFVGLVCSFVMNLLVFVLKLDGILFFIWWVNLVVFCGKVLV